MKDRIGYIIIIDAEEKGFICTNLAKPSYAAIALDIDNQGEDSFKPDVYGNVFKLECRITESSISTILKDQHVTHT